MGYMFSDVKKAMRHFSGVSNKKARVELESLINDMFANNLNTGQILNFINKSMRVAYLQEGIEKD